jgi:DNA adenine methylase
MVELDSDVAAVWKTILTDDVEWLVESILTFDVSVESVREQLDQQAASLRERAFHTILKNRCFHGGILAAGSGLMKAGENGRGIRSRWYPDTLRRRILAISELRDRITFLHEDGISTIEQHRSETNTAFFIDPPYTAGGKRAGRRLYTHSQLDHHFLFRACEDVAGDFLMTYDISDEIVTLADQHGFSHEEIPMKNTHHAKMHELLISKDLSWVGGAPDCT